MISSTTASKLRRNLRGTRSSAAAWSSSSAAAATLEEDEDGLNDTPPPASQILEHLEIHESDKLAYKRLKQLSIDI